MMRKWAVILAACGFASLVGCGMQRPLGGGAALTADQQAAITSALVAAQGILDANEAAVAGTESEQQGNDPNASSIRSQGITFGTCPAVTLANLLNPGQPRSLTIDFGAGCEPPRGDGVTCSGSATGTIQFDPREIVLTYDSFGCDVRTADGTYSATWTRSDGTVSFQGDWDLTVDPADGVATAILGGGVADYVDADATTTIVSWSGTLTREEQTWNVTMTNLAVSYQNNQNLIPGSGTIVVTGTQLGTVATTFDADSPTTGEVSVSINGGPEFPYTLSR